MRSKIFIVDDNPVVREMLCQYVEIMPDLEVCGSAASAEEALQRIDGDAVDLVLVDMALPEMNGADLIQALRKRWSDLKCIVLSGHGERGYVRRAFEAGASGYVLKGEPYQLPNAIADVLSGKTVSQV